MGECVEKEGPNGQKGDRIRHLKSISQRMWPQQQETCPGSPLEREAVLNRAQQEWHWRHEDSRWP